MAVGRAKNFSLASRALAMPVSTLSRRIADFERRLGVQLLVRSTRRVELTESGNRYFERCCQLLDAADSAHAELLGEQDCPRGPLRVSASQDFALTFLPPILADFCGRYPGITFDLDVTPRVVDMIAEGIDVTIRTGALPDSQLLARRLGSYATSLYAAPAYLRLVEGPASPAELERHECLCLAGVADGQGAWTLQRGQEIARVPVRGRLVANSGRLLLDLAIAGLGVAAINDVIARRAVEWGSLVRVLPEWTLPPVPVHALTPSRLLPARTRLFLDCLSGHLASTSR